jgi:hypothetical protein
MDNEMCNAEGSITKIDKLLQLQISRIRTYTHLHARIHARTHTMVCATLA